MKNKLYLTLTLVLVLVGVDLLAGTKFSHGIASDKDSIIVTFGDKTRMIIYGENRKELDKIVAYDLNALLQDLKVRLDSTSADTTYLREEFNGNKYLKDPSQ